MTSRAATPWSSDQEGFVAGLESLAFGVLVFVVGTLVVLNAWSVVDAKLAVESAAREAARAVVEAGSTGSGTGTAGHYRAVARSTATRVLGGMRGGGSVDTGGDVLDLSADPVVVGGLSRGECVRVTLEVEVPLVAIPIVEAGGGTRRVVGSHVERVDPYRSGLEAADPELIATPCL